VIRVRIEGDADTVSWFLKTHKYPYAEQWPADFLRQHAIMVRLEETHDRFVRTVGYAWATWHPTLPSTLDFHVCIDPKYRGRWLDVRVWVDLQKLAQFLGAEMLITRTPTERAARLVSELLVRRFGFKRNTDGSVYKLLKDT
jgi:ribosomal protein S18 acetylase RimI-like enzyme